jgi:hypothetical protein
VEKKPCTVPEGFRFLEREEQKFLHKQAALHKPNTDPSTPVVTPFKATSLNRKIFSCGDSGIPKLEKRPSTVPEGFRFLEREEEKHLLKQATKQQNGVVHRFKASPMPLTTPFRPVLPNRKIETMPYTLATEQRCATSRQNKTPEKPFVFKAQPWNLQDFAKPPATPRGTRPLTEIQAFELKSDGRAARRAAWDSGRKLKEQAKKEATAIQEKENQENEARVLKALRKALIHRPQPLPSKIRKGQTRSKSTVVCSRPRSMTAMARSMSTTAQA